MRCAPLLILVALLLSLAPADPADADCGPGSPPDCSCVVLTEFVPQQITLQQPIQLLEPLPVTPAEIAAGELVLNLPNYFPGPSTFLSNVNVASTPVFTVIPGSYSYMPILPAEPIPTIATLAPSINLPLFSPTINPPHYTSSNSSSSGVLSFSIYNNPTNEGANSGNLTLTVVSIDPLSILNFSVNELSDPSVPEPSSFALFILGLVAIRLYRSRVAR